MKGKDLNPKTGKAFQWNGLLIQQARFGYVIQEANIEKPMYWYNWEVEKQKALGIEPCMIPAIEVTASSGKPFTIANIGGIGIYKLEAGGMWTHPHLSLDGEFFEDEAFAVYEFSQDDYMIYQKGLENYQREKHPQEFERLQALKKVARPLLPSNEDLGLIPSAPKHGKSGATSLHLKFRKGKK